MSGDELPDGWTASGIDQLCHKITDGTHFSPKEQNRRGGYKYVTAKNIREWGLDLSDVTYVSEAIHRPIFQRCNPEKDDVLYIKDGATAGIAILNPLEEEFSLLSSVALLKPDRSRLDPSFLKWYLMSPVGRKAMLDQVTGSAITRLTLEIIRKSEIPAPPLPEQKRIVAKVEELLARANAARGRLARVPAVLKRFRQTVLAAACEGRLTEACRPEAADVNAAPNGWRLAALEELSERITKGTTPTSYGHSYQTTGIPFIRVENLKGGRIDRQSVRHCISEDTHRSQSRSMLQQGDLLFSIAGTIGETALVAADDVPANTNQAVAIIRGTARRADADYLLLVLRSIVGQDAAQAAARGGGMNNISLADVRALRIPIPPRSEQREIVRRVEALFKLADAIEKRVAAATARAEKLTQAILAKAFRGELVPIEADLTRNEGRTHEPNEAPAKRPTAFGVNRPKSIKSNRRVRPRVTSS